MEQELITHIRNNSGPLPPGVLLGIGDDAALLDLRDADTAITVDLLTDGVDFLLEETDPKLIGRKAIAVNLSDLAAMSVLPFAAVVAVVLPRKPVRIAGRTLTPLELGRRLFEGMHELAAPYGLAIVGGDTNSWNGPLAISITALGKTTEKTTGKTPLRRDGAKPGDSIFVTGPLGGSILEHQFTFEPRVRESLVLNARFEIHAMIDISDGLSLDLSRIAASSGCGFLLDSERIPVSEAAYRLAEEERTGRRKPLGGTPLSAEEHALKDGEDFELLFSTDRETAATLLQTQPLRSEYGVKLYEIGECTPPGPAKIRRPDGTVEPLTVRGFLH